MNWLKKLFRKYSLKELKLRELKSGESIYIDIPNGYSKTINGKQYNDQPISIEIENNDPIGRKIWFFCRVDGFEVSFVKSYDSPELKNFLLFNINTVELNHVNVAKKSKEELKKELEKAISNENYEMAKIINNKLKELE